MCDTLLRRRSAWTLSGKPSVCYCGCHLPILPPSPHRGSSTPSPLNLLLFTRCVCMFDPISSIGSGGLAPLVEGWGVGMNSAPIAVNSNCQRLCFVFFFQIDKPRALSVWPFAFKSVFNCNGPTLTCQKRQPSEETGSFFLSHSAAYTNFFFPFPLFFVCPRLSLVLDLLFPFHSLSRLFPSSSPLFLLLLFSLGSLLPSLLI